MEWRDQGLIIGVRRHGETSAIVELFTSERGRHTGLVRGGRSRKMQPLLQLGNSVHAHWHSRLDEHLGTYNLEMSRSRAALLMESPTSLHGLQWLCQLLRLSSEREPHPVLYQTAMIVAEHLSDAATCGALMARFELGFLSELGFGLALEECAVTGSNQALNFVSPKTGRAVCDEAAEPYKARLLPLPKFLVDTTFAVEHDDLTKAFALTCFFLERNIFGPRAQAIPDARGAFVSGALEKMAENSLPHPQQNVF